MKKLVYLIVAIVVLGLVVSGCIPVVPTLVEKNNGNGNNGLKPPSGAHYNLNIIGKKSDWSGGGSYDNPARHTMFVPQDTSEYTAEFGGTGITIWMSRGDEFAVLDGNAFDGEARFQLGSGKYKVYIVAKAKPGGDTDITGWLYDPNTAELYLETGTLKVGGHSKNWKDATFLFYYEEEWIFDYLQALIDDSELDPGAYFWQYDNHGNKLVKVRFYRD